jgi:hypothetical protein
MCWAAAASNILEWTGWGRVGNITTADQIFAYFQDHWTDYGNYTKHAWDWWFDGTNDSEGWEGFSQVDVLGGGFFPNDFDPNKDFDHFFHETVDDGAAMDAIADYLQSGIGVTLTIGLGVKRHAITCWGYVVDADNPDVYRGVYITNSDDDKGSLTPVDELQYYEVRSANGQWCLEDMFGNDWFISGVYGLERRPPDRAAATGVPQVPASLPTTRLVVAQDLRNSHGMVAFGGAPVYVPRLQRLEGFAGQPGRSAVQAVGRAMMNFEINQRVATAHRLPTDFDAGRWEAAVDLLAASQTDLRGDAYAGAVDAAFDANQVWRYAAFHDSGPRLHTDPCGLVPQVRQFD